MRKICFFVGDISLVGGTERVTSLISSALSNDGFEVTILSLFMDGEVKFDIDEKITITKLFEEKISMKKNFLRCIIKLRRFLLSNKIDTLIVVDSISCIFSVPALIGLKINHICWEHFNFINNNGSRLRDFARKLAAHYCDVVVTLTHRDQELWKKGIKKIKAKMVTIPNPCTFEKTNNLPSLNYKIVLAVGRLTKVKGFDLLLEAWAKVCQKNQGWILRIVGDGEERENLQNLANHLCISDRVDFVGKVDDVAEYYKTSSFLCLSSRNEGLPMVMLEAQAFGLPIVAFDCDTGPAEIIEHGKNGYLVENQNVDLLIFSLLKLIYLDSGDYEVMIHNSKNNLLFFDLGHIIARWELIV